LDPPERIVLNVTADPATSIAVTWRNFEDYSDSRIQIAKASDWTDLAKDARTVPARKEGISYRNNTPDFHYSAVITDLQPDVLYAYRVGHDSVWSGWAHFRTAKSGQAPFTFSFFGDPQYDLVRYCSRVFHETFKTAPDSRFWLFVGDMIGDPEYDSLWCELFTSVGFIPTTTPFVMVPGNHEYPKPKGTETQKELVPYWRAHYTLPENGIKGLEETSYSFDYQGVRFIMINGNEKLAEQATWMEPLLARNPCAWTVVAVHQPLYSMGRTRDERQTRDALLPLIDKYGVDLVLTGHDHVYSRSHKLKNGVVVRPDEKGTVYVVSVSGSKAYPLHLKYKDLMVKTAENVQLFQTITVDGNTLTYKSYTATGSLFDSFELKK
jgi:3',5'-cyclic AMP phosphodiesterase CpdA